MTIALLPTAFGFKEGGVPALPLEADVIVATLGPSHHQAWVQHVTLFFGTSVDMGAPAPDLPSIHDDGGVDGDCVGLQGPGLRALTLDLPTLGIPEPQRKGGEEMESGWERARVRQSFSLSWPREQAWVGWGKDTGGEGALREPPGETLCRPRPRQGSRLFVSEPISAREDALESPNFKDNCLT